MNPMRSRNTGVGRNLTARKHWRPYNSIRFICECGRKLTFPRSPKGGRKATAHETFPDGTVKIVTERYKEVHCACGACTAKDREGFRR